MSEEETIAALEAGIEALNSGNHQGYIDMYADSVTLPGSASGDKESLEVMYDMIFTALPDMSLEIQEMMVDGNTVALIYHWEGTHEGELLGVPPTGETIEFPNGMTWMQFNDEGKVEKRWVPPGVWQHILQEAREAADEEYENPKELV
jgi:steroid delta-isomerase-like uncharacterized protein